MITLIADRKLSAYQQLGGACDEAFHTDSFDALTTLIQQHERQIFQQNATAHIATAPIDAMQVTQTLMADAMKQ